MQPPEGNGEEVKLREGSSMEISLLHRGGMEKVNSQIS